MRQSVEDIMFLAVDYIILAAGIVAAGTMIASMLKMMNLYLNMF